MYRLAVATVALALFLSTAGPSQEKKAKGQLLPQGWKALDLSPEQKAKAYAVHADYKAKVMKLQDEIKALQSAEKADLVKILTPEQKKKLSAALIGEPTDPKKEDKKADKSEK